MRIEFNIIQDWVKQNSRVLDLGCGDGTLLSQLRHNKNIEGLGIEMNNQLLTSCVEKELSVIQQDLNAGLSNFANDSFDTVIMTLTLQAMHRPDQVLEEMLRVGKTAIVAFPNFGNWRSRYALLFNGRMPVSPFMPFEWFDTPNIHFCTISDFEILCQQKKIQVVNKTTANAAARQPIWVKIWPNWFSTVAVYHLTR